MLPFVRVFIFLICVSIIYCTRVKIEKNGYKDILISLPHNIKVEDRPRIVRNIENMMRSSSVLLQMATKGRAYFSDATFLVPHEWKISERSLAWKLTSFNSSAFSEPRAALTIEEADIVVTATGQNPYVLHQGGCGQRAMRIVLPIDFLLRNKNQDVEFLRLWSEYRYGVFPEGGFFDDEKYPHTYHTPDGKEEKRTGCSDKTFWSSSLCNEGDKQCSDTSFTSSVMDQHLPSSAILFCEGSISLGPRHDPESPSKHNLICQEEGTWFTVMKSKDFSNGRNAAPKYLQRSTDVAFRFVREPSAPRLIVAIEISSKMKQKNRFNQAVESFYEFVYSVLPYGSELILVVFGDEESVYMPKHPTILKAEDTRIFYLNSRLFPIEPSEMNNVSMAQLFNVIFQFIEDSNENIEKASPDIIIVTTENRLNFSVYEEVKKKFLNTESRLHVMMYPDTEEFGSSQDEVSLQTLCDDTGGEFLSLHADAFGDMNRGFVKSIGSHNEEILILQDYLNEDDTYMETTFVVEESLSENLKVTLSFPDSDGDPLEHLQTYLKAPSGGILNFMRMSFMKAWQIDMAKPEIGEHILRITRMKGYTAPVLVTITGRSIPSEDPILVNVWTETVDDFQEIPQPIKIYAEVKKGWNPVRGASVTASVKHPDGQISELVLLDDGLGDVDITKDDGIYGRYFTNFTVSGYYNAYVEVTQGNNVTEVMIGPVGFCCGSHFSAFTAYSAGTFRREAGPFSFYISYKRNASEEDKYPPARVTDLQLNNMFDRICVLHWTAVGDDFDSGFAKIYELAVFRDMAIIRSRFSGSGLEIYREFIPSTPEATHGTLLNHAFQLPENLKGGIYYAAIRAIDDAGNAGVPSNIVPIFIEQSLPKIISCKNGDDNCGNGGCRKLPEAAKLQGNAARNLISAVMTLYIPTNVFIPILSLMLSLVVLNIL